MFNDLPLTDLRKLFLHALLLMRSLDASVFSFSPFLAFLWVLFPARQWCYGSSGWAVWAVGCQTMHFLCAAISPSHSQTKADKH